MTGFGGDELVQRDLPGLDLVLSDIRLRGPRSGLDLATALADRGVRRIALMTSLPPADPTRAAAAARFALLPKPFDAATLAQWRGLPYHELAFEILSLFIDDIPAADLRAICRKTYTEEVFGSQAIVPLKPLEELPSMSAKFRAAADIMITNPFFRMFSSE